MKSKSVLFFFLFLMAGLIFTALFFPVELQDLLMRPSLYKHILFLHILSATLFFANAVVGILWELRCLFSGSKDIIMHSYDTVSRLDARFSSPLIVLSVLTGIMLTLMMGDIWQIGWLSLAYFLFLFSGAMWVLSDIPTQYKINKLLENTDPDAATLPPQLMGLLKMRIWISMAGVLPLLIVFILMVYKPDITPIVLWFK